MTIQQEILAKIKAYDTIIIHRHMRPDPDAIGSQVGLAEIIRANFPEKKVYQVGKSTEGLEFLASMQTIEDQLYQGSLVIVTDTANSPRISDDRYHLGDFLIKIDHHPNDEPYGDLVWVDTKASSCSEMIAQFWYEQKEELVLTSQAARLLYAGIVGDTGRFLYPATSSQTLFLASQLLQYPFEMAKLNRQLSQISYAVSQLVGYVYQHLTIDENGVANVYLPLAILNEYQVTDAMTASLVPLPGEIDCVQTWALFVEQPEGYYRVRLRSKERPINEIAKRHHGGGHPLASGANAYSLEETKEIYQEMQALFS
ncbi:DHH family phosphoesterase [Enterococcus columbae]|uniref:Phosphoesterase RecJ protein n=1 Tax=Enterococcus columbae DSM 7374 = ATCC 51263 TaxID=1121865 RepID=S0KLV5_9ENTE|nr:bifunctional oligoribonuclease/PAP phosphatase NrnA [Enterococcus columbae]EOT41985.1 phosphoesterase RecJ protein [Enterococcus columbae DSM 7374 = ATCC 51263]EOW80542.1 phosphoesterase RecJ protein [Enterococcus columbae DSM 7374 = ATCC 51263]OJG26383.1 phosphoesterase RecJ protein [Enterococcus columbae DSM 7374 = ATCC 51263]